MITDQTIIDGQTGEVLEHSINITKKVQERRFIQVYIDDLKGLLKVENGIQSNVLALIWQACTYSTEQEQWNKIAILKDTKEKWAQQLNCSIKTIDNTLTALVKKELIASVCRGVYVLNPKYFFKGTSQANAVVLRTEQSYFIDHEE